MGAALGGCGYLPLGVFLLTHSQHHIAGVRRSAGPLSEVLLSCLQVRGDWGLDSEESTWDFPSKYYLGKYLLSTWSTHTCSSYSIL